MELQAPRPPGLVSQGSCCWQSGHTLLCIQESLRATPPWRLDDTGKVHWSGPKGPLLWPTGRSRPAQQPGKHSQGPPSVTSLCRSSTSSERDGEGEVQGGQGTHRVRLALPPFHGAAPRQCPASVGGEGCGHHRAHPLTQPEPGRCLVLIRALKGRQGPRPCPGFAAPSGWSPGDPDDPRPRLLPSLSSAPSPARARGNARVAPGEQQADPG